MQGLRNIDLCQWALLGQEGAVLPEYCNHPGLRGDMDDSGLTQVVVSRALRVIPNGIVPGTVERGDGDAWAKCGCGSENGGCDQRQAIPPEVLQYKARATAARFNAV